MSWRGHLATPFLLCLAVLSFMALGCGGGGVERHDLHGRVSYKGEPVPFGMISFRPDRKQGGSGPSGFAQIVDGEYSTKLGSGKGAVSGPVQVVIEGAVAKKPMAAALFPIYKTSISVDGKNDEFDFEVPDQVSPKIQSR